MFETVIRILGGLLSAFELSRENVFLNKAREVFELIDKDDSGSLAIDEITTAVKSDAVVKDFLKTCGDETLMFLLQPKRLDHALRELDTDGSGEVDIDECTATGVLLTYRRFTG